MMKDYRLSEMKAICDEHINNGGCASCPLERKECAIVGQFIPSKWLVSKDDELIEDEEVLRILKKLTFVLRNDERGKFLDIAYFVAITKVAQADRTHLEQKINEIGYKNVLNIIPSHEYDGTITCVIYKEKDNDK